MDRIPVLLDTDIGSDIDDAVALAYLLSEKRCELAGITTVTGEVAKRAALAQILCEAAGRAAIPVHCGTSKTLGGPGQPEVPQYAAVSHLPHRIDWPQDTAIPFLAETIRQRPGEIVLLSIGPLTNVARLFSQYPETPSLLRGWFAMSGYFNARRRGSWNVTCDPASAAIAFDTPVARSVQIGEDVTSKCRLSREEMVARFRHPLLRLVLTMAESWFEQRSEIVFHDPLAAAAVFHEALFPLSKGSIDIDPRGRTSFRPDDKGGHEVATHVNRQAFFKAFFSAFD